MKDILTQIVEKRVSDIEKQGVTFGFDIPSERTRKIHQFLPQKGVILEVKRASPSKGDIAPNLDSKETARSYCESGAGAISCLTETNYFKGTLKDLMNVCAAVDEYEKSSGKTGPAVLRKDFLVSEEEVDVAYRAGADAVLLISRILSKEKMRSMAHRAASYGITSLIEIRLDEDIEKLAVVCQSVDKKFIACGVNSRDLATFTIDLLTPCRMFDKIRAVLGADARVIFESGIRSSESADFVGALGFDDGVWRERLFCRLACGGCRCLLLSGWCCVLFRGGRFCCRLGFIFWNKSPRHIQVEEAEKVISSVENAVKVAVIVDPSDAEAKCAIDLCRRGVIDVIQLHTIACARKFLADSDLKSLPHYAAINISDENDVALLDELFEKGEPRVLVDASVAGKIGGTGKQISGELIKLVQKKYPLWLAGGINAENVALITGDYAPELIDCATGVESSAGKKDFAKLEKFFKALTNAK